MASPAGCTLCKFLVQEIDVYIGQNKTAEQINATVYALCKKLPAPLSSLCTTYAPIIIKDVMAGLNPEQTCEKVKLCTNSSSLLPKELNPHDITEKLERMASPAGCTLCKFLVQEIDVYIGQNKTVEQINATVYALCKKLPAPLGSLCTTYAPIIIKDVMAGLNPEQTCEKIKLCTNSSSLFSTDLNPHDVMKQLEVKASPGCLLCKLLVQEIDAYIGQNKTAEQINATVYALCKKLPAPLGSLCTTYAPIIIKDVMAGFDPEQTCEKVKLCTNSSSSLAKMLKSYSLKKEIDVKVEASPGCTICKFLVQEIDYYVSLNYSEAQLNSTLYGLCAKLPVPLASICKAYAPIILKDVMAGFDPEKTCEQIKLCTTSPGCTLCKFLVEEIDHYMAMNQSAAQINATVYSLCAKLTAPLAVLCLEYAPIIIKDAMAGLDPEQTCEKVKLCTTSSLPLAEEFKLHSFKEELTKKIEAGPGCTLCKFLVQEIDTYIGQNKTAEQINATVYALCKKLPAPLGSLCEAYAPVIIKDVMAGFDPEQTCEKVKLCTKSSLSLDEAAKLHYLIEKELEENIKASPGCTLCKFLVQEIDHYVAMNQSAAQINATVFALCAKLPAPLASLCQAYAPIIIKDVMAGFDPEQTCEKVKLCTKEVLPLTKEFEPEVVEEEIKGKIQDGPGCVICKLIVQEIDTLIAENKSAAEINATVFNLCGKLPATIKSLCYAYAPMIVKDVLSGLNPQQTCVKVKLCTNGTYIEPLIKESAPEEKSSENNSKMTVTVDPLCGLCEFVVQLVDQYIAENKSIAVINASVMGICKLLPANLRNPCILFAPQIVNIIDSGVDPQAACKAIKMCLNNGGQKELTGLSCGQCHGIVETFLPKKYTPKFGNLMCMAACPVARRRRAIDKDLNLDFVSRANPKGSWRCDLCEFIIEAINTYFKNNVTDRTLEQYMDDICKFMPQPFKDQCLKSVPEILQELEHGFDQNVLCQHYLPDECKNDTETFFKKEMLEKIFQAKQKDKDSRCEMCKDIIKFIDGSLNHDKNEVKSYVDDVCSRLPSPTNKACKSFAGAELEDILMRIINKLLTPEEVCHMVHVC